MTMVRSRRDKGVSDVAHPNEDLVREAFAAFGRGDLEALQRQYFTEDILYHFPGRSPLAGDYQGVAQVLELLAGPSSSPAAHSTSRCTTSSPTTSTLSRCSRPAPNGPAGGWKTTPSRSPTSVKTR